MKYRLLTGGVHLEHGSHAGRASIRGGTVEVARFVYDHTSEGSGSVGPDHPYMPAGLRVYVGRPPEPQDPMLHQKSVAWPLSTPLGSFGTTTSTPTSPEPRCGAVTGPDLQQLLPLAASANQLTPWTSDGKEYALSFRVLLPDERDC